MGHKDLTESIRIVRIPSFFLLGFSSVASAKFVKHCSIFVTGREPFSASILRDPTAEIVTGGINCARHESVHNKELAYIILYCLPNRRLTGSNLKSLSNGFNTIVYIADTTFVPGLDSVPRRVSLRIARQCTLQMLVYWQSVRVQYSLARPMKHIKWWESSRKGFLRAYICLSLHKVLWCPLSRPL